MDPDSKPADATHRSPADPPPGPGSATPTPRIGDAAIGFAVEATRLTLRGAVALGRVARPVTSLVPWPALPDWSQTRLREAAERGRSTRVAAERQVGRVAATVLPRVVAAILDRLDLTAIVIDYVDLDGVVQEVDLDAAVDRVDIGRIVDRVDIGRIVDRVDIDAIAATIDIDAIADRIDIGRIVDRVDIDAIAATIDIDAIVDRVDIDGVAARLDMDAVIDRIDLIGIARYIVDTLDLPAIIRQSTGVMTSDAVSEVRLQGIQADELVSRAVDRLLLRRKARHTDVAGLTTSGPNGAAPHPDDERHDDG